MTTKELLGKYYDIEMNNVFCYSATYLMDSPKKAMNANGAKPAKALVS